MKHFTGLMAAVFTPFDQRGRINLSVIPEYVNYLIANNLKGIFICGSNGEGPNMTIGERKAIAEAFIKAVDNRIQVFVHVGHSCITDARELALHAQSIGADAISAVACFYFKPTSVNNLVEAMAEIADAAPEIPFYYYHIPRLTGVDMNMVTFLEMAGNRISNLAGIKYSGYKIYEFQSCLDYRQGQFNILYGLDEMLLPALAVGASGAIGSTYTFAAPLYYQVMDAFKHGETDKAKRLQQNLVHMINILLKYPPIPAQKAIMKMIGLDLGPSRLPLQSLSTTEFNDLKNELKETEVWNNLIK